MMHRFIDRRHAGRLLAVRLQAYADRPDTLVVALLRGGMPVAAEVARTLHLPLDICVVRKLGAPGREELALGAIAAAGVRVLNHVLIRDLAVPAPTLQRIEEEERRVLDRRERTYRGTRPPPPLVGRTVVIVDDGLATGATMHAAILSLRARGAGRIVAAVPVASREACSLMARVADECICLARPEPFGSVGQWYDQFPQLTDAEMLAHLIAADRLAAAGSPP